MKLGIAYIVFDGVELLEHSINQIRNQVDHIQVIYQSTSWFGHPLKAEDLSMLESLRTRGVINELARFSNFDPLRNTAPGAIAKAKQYEMEKRQFGLVSALRVGCTHYLCMDVDEFYLEEEFAAAKKEIVERDYGLTSVRFINYVNLPTLNRGYDSSRVPFICKINERSKMSRGFFVKCDPTRGIYSPTKTLTHDFDPGTITMHHMETVRRDLTLKYEATTRAIFNRSKTKTLVDNIRCASQTNPTLDFDKIIFPSLNKMKLNSCANVFKIPYEEWQRLR